MAYQTKLASIPENRIDAFRRSHQSSLHASRVIECSHLIAYGVEVQPLGKLLGKAIDGGELLDPNLWHSFRPPVFHTAKAVQELYLDLKKVWEQIQREFPVSDEDWYGKQIKEVIDLFNWAQERKEAIISIISLPFDVERAAHIIEPRLL